MRRVVAPHTYFAVSRRVVIPRNVEMDLIGETWSRGSAPLVYVRLRWARAHNFVRVCLRDGLGVTAVASQLPRVARDSARPTAPRQRSRAVAGAALNTTRATPSVWLQLPSFPCLTLSTRPVRGTPWRRLRLPAPAGGGGG